MSWNDYKHIEKLVLEIIGLIPNTSVSFRVEQVMGTMEELKNGKLKKKEEKELLHVLWHRVTQSG